MAGAKITFRTGQGGLPLLRVETAGALADIYLHGAHVTHYQRHGEQPVLFLSRQAEFARGKAIRGGVPVILPWFGGRAGQASHGFARTAEWELLEVGFSGEDFARLRFRLPEVPEAADWPKFVAEYEVLVGDMLELELKLTNVDAQRVLSAEACLHSYFAVGDIAKTEVVGLQGAHYLDATDAFQSKEELPPAIRFKGEVDRIYVNAPQTVSIVDHGLGRVIEVAKQNSLSTVVWNPWAEKARQLKDLADDEFQRMVCVESGNVKQNQSLLQPGESAVFNVAIDCRPF
jgi:D-hexose-6-phosphate mutarotase